MTVQERARHVTGSRVRGVRPRKLGLLQEVRWRRGPLERHAYSYAVGDRIGDDLTVIGHLAGGRWSELYQVWNAREWCPLTCKILTFDSGRNRTARAAMRREHRILRKLMHPNIVRVFGGGEHDGLGYLLLEYLEGPSALDALEALPGRRMGIADAVRTAIQAGAGLAHLHRTGFLHLDLKPANLLLREGVPVLLDLELARPIHPAVAPRNRLGTAPYMSPEQVLQVPLGIPADVYGLAATLYEFLTGRWPFEDIYSGKNQRTGIESQYPQIGNAPPPSPRELRPDVTTSLDRVVMRALARNPRARFASLPEFLLTLSAELTDTVSLWPKKAHPERELTH